MAKAKFLSSFAQVADSPFDEAGKAYAASEKNYDLMHARFILCHADKNANLDEFEDEELKQSYSTIINKPLNTSHTDKNIGVVYSSEYIDVSELTDAQRDSYIGIDLDKDFIVCNAAVWKYKHEKESEKMKKKAAKGQLRFSMEVLYSSIKCSVCNAVFAAKEKSVCEHMATRKKTGAGRKLLGTNFIGVAEVDNPADKKATSLAIAQEHGLNRLPDVLFTKVFANIQEPQQIIPYAYSDSEVELRKIELGEAFAYNGDETCADETNKYFPIGSKESVLSSVKSFFDNDLTDYQPMEKVAIALNLIQAANDYEVDIKEYTEKGVHAMPIDKNSEEFKKALAEEVKIQVDKLSEKTDVADLTAQNLALASEKQAVSDELKTANDELTKVQAEFASFKQGVEKEKTIAARLVTIKAELGDIKLEPAELESLASIDDNAFNVYLTILKKASKKGDPVKESAATIANTIDDDKTKSALDSFDQIFKRSGK